MGSKDRFGRTSNRRIYNEPEHLLQSELVAWIRFIIAVRRIDTDRGTTIPLSEIHRRQWNTIHSIPNGGKRNKTVASKMAMEGQKAGVSDLMWPLASGGFHGLYLETKVDEIVPTSTGARRYRTDLSPSQIEFKRDVEANGYAHRTYRSLDEGKAILVAYFLGRPLPEERQPAERKPRRKPDIAAIAALRQREEKR